MRRQTWFQRRSEKGSKDYRKGLEELVPFGRTCFREDEVFASEYDIAHVSSTIVALPERETVTIYIMEM